MKASVKFSSLFLAASLAVGSLGFTSCSDDKGLIEFNPYGKSDVVLTYFGVMPATRGDSIIINGENLNKVKAVIFPIDINVEDFRLIDDQNIKVEVPQEALAGKLRLLTASGEVITSVSHLSFVEKIKVTKIEPTTDLLPGDEITVTGDALYNVASVTFSDGVTVESTDFVSADRYTLVVKVPRGAVSGTVTFSDGNDDEPWSYTYPTPLDIINATVTGIDKTDYEFGEVMTITGTHLEFVDKVTFPGGIEPEVFTISEDGTTITVEIPDECGPGQVELTLASGNVVTTPEFTLPVIKITDVTVNGTSVGTKDVTNAETGETSVELKGIEDFEPGMNVVITGENFDRVRRVYFPGYTDKMKAGEDYQQSATEITFVIPEKMNDGNIQLYQNKTISLYHAATKLVELPFIWKGEVVMAGWGGSLCPATWEPALWKKFMEREGSLASGPGLMTLYYTPDATSDQNYLKMVYGDWATPWENVAKDENFDAEASAIAIDPASANYKVEITQADIDKFKTDGSFVIFGTGLTLTAVKYEPGKTLGGGDTPQPSNDPIVIWEKEVTLSWGVGGRVCVGAEHFENVKAGTLLRFNFNCTAETWCQAQINDGGWAHTMIFEAVMPEDLFDGDGNPITSYSCTDGVWVPSDMFGWNNFHNFHEADFILTQEHIDNILAKRSDCSDENEVDCGLIIQGSDITFTKVSLVPQN